jgi:7,8-dihydropterin-6-yl-methyl-4-(beta-D-ribofuranosyl)aminobenzene 5'-phosphate synthase
MSNLQLLEADRLEVTILVDNYSDVFLESAEGIKRHPPVPGTELLAEHGLSCLLKVYANSDEHWVLVDAGISPTCFLQNAAVLGLDLAKIESVILSHGHFDHFGALMAFLGRAKKGITLVVHPDVFLERRINIPTIGLVEEMPGLDEMALKETGVTLRKAGKASTLASGHILVTGEVERVTDFEKGFPWAEAKINGKWVVDPFHDDQGVTVNVKGKGLVIIGGCSHSGIINIVRYAQKLTRTEKVHAVLGGFHLSGPLFESIIEPTIEEMKKIAPDFVVPMHCTGWKAINQFALKMPEQFRLNSVGTTYVF